MNLEKSMKRLVKSVNEAMEAKKKEENQKIKESKEDKRKITKADIIKSLPISKDTWYSYKSFANSGSKQILGLNTDTLYNLCKYANVSADYILGFNDIPVKEASAEQIKKDFGLSDDALRCLSEMNKPRKLPLPMDYNKVNEINFIDFFITRLAKRLLQHIIYYFNEVDEFEYLKEEYKKYPELSQIQFDHLNDAEHKMDINKFIIFQDVDRFIQDFIKELRNVDIQDKNSEKQ